MTDERKIISITVAEIGKIFRFGQVKRENKQPDETTWVKTDNPIEMFTVNGEMAPVTWYRQGNREWNGKYVIEVEYQRV